MNDDTDDAGGALRCRLYLITPPAIDPEAFAPLLEEALSGGDVACLQLRLKDVPDSEVVRAAEVLKPLCDAHDVALIINDSASIARLVGADGVHLGQDDGDVREARRLLGHGATIGVTCHNSRDLAFRAGEAGADYVAFGAFFPTATKEVKFQAEPELLSWWNEIAELPCVAIGGITVDNAAALAAAGADFIAVSSGVWDYAGGPKAAVEKFNDILEAAAN